MLGTSLFQARERMHQTVVVRYCAACLTVSKRASKLFTIGSCRRTRQAAGVLTVLECSQSSPNDGKQKMPKGSKKNNLSRKACPRSLRLSSFLSQPRIQSLYV